MDGKLTIRVPPILEEVSLMQQNYWFDRWSSYVQIWLVSRRLLGVNLSGESKLLHDHSGGFERAKLFILDSFIRTLCLLINDAELFAVSQ